MTEVTMRLLHALGVCGLLINCISGIPWTQEKLTHRAVTLTAGEINSVLAHTDLEQMWQRDLTPLLVTRYPGTAGSLAVQQPIIKNRAHWAALEAGWNVTEDRFEAHTPYGSLTFTNLIANPGPVGQEAAWCWPAHFDSQSSSPDLTLQLLFFDGEEAMFQWTATDSLYGSRHLAQHMESTPHPADASDTNLLHGIDLFVLLDLIGAPGPRFGSQFASTSRWLTRLQQIERRLHAMGQLVEHPNQVEYFWPNIPVGPHDILCSACVRVLHLIPSPFPSVWHTFDDNEENLDRSTIQNLNKILQIFSLEYLNARPTDPQNPHNAP
ncbi:hypothetical protein CRUP_024326 [Coryphaenoides rupestris]|nr:hypothetical protein CRUP_024326 [Coryphaenoides rupestris]